MRRPAAGQPGLTDILDVTRDLKIYGDRTHIGELFVIVKTGVSVSTEIMSNDRAEDIRIAGQTHVAAGRIKSCIDIPRWGDGDRLSGPGRWADSVKLETTRLTYICQRRRRIGHIVVYNFARLRVEVSGKPNLRIYPLVDGNRSSHITIHHNCDIGFLSLW